VRSFRLRPSGYGGQAMGQDPLVRHLTGGSIPRALTNRSFVLFSYGTPRAVFFFKIQKAKVYPDTLGLTKIQKHAKE